MKHIIPFGAITESRKYDYGCVMIYMDIPGWDNILSSIDPMDLYLPNEGRYGVEDEPHLTLLYGLHEEVTPAQVSKSLDGFIGEKVEIVADGISLFENKDYDVVKINVIPTTDLKDMNYSLRRLPHTTDYPDYNPHLTVAYVKKGKGHKYNRDYKLSLMVDCRVVYSMTDGTKVDID
jgi:2'-5' RNA ligase